MDRITRHPLLEDIPFETVIDYAVDFIRIMGIPPIFEDKTADIEIKDYRGVLPCDFYEMVQVRLAKPHGKTFRYTTDSFHMSPHHRSTFDDREVHQDLTYKLQGNCIFTSPLKDGRIEIAYRALMVDEDGYPLIPDKGSFVRALEMYIKKQWFTIQFDLGKISQQAMQKADQDYSWAVGQAQSDLVIPSIDQMEAIANMWNTLIPRYEHSTGFINEGTQEHLKIH